MVHASTFQANFSSTNPILSFSGRARCRVDLERSTWWVWTAAATRWTGVRPAPPPWRWARARRAASGRRRSTWARGSTGPRVRSRSSRTRTTASGWDSCRPEPPPSSARPSPSRPRRTSTWSALATRSTGPTRGASPSSHHTSPVSLFTASTPQSRSVSKFVFLSIGYSKFEARL